MGLLPWAHSPLLWGPSSDAYMPTSLGVNLISHIKHLSTREGLYRYKQIYVCGKEYSEV